jgi:SAM-dependent methyltransferase
MAFTDMEIPLTIGGRATGETMLAPKVEARILQELGVRKHESVLEIGAGSGHMAALLAHRARHVDTLEIDADLARFATENLAARGGRERHGAPRRRRRPGGQPADLRRDRAVGLGAGGAGASCSRSSTPADGWPRSSASCR